MIPTGRYHMTCDGEIVSHYLADGCGGRAGDPVEYYGFEIESAARVLSELLRCSVEPKVISGLGGAYRHAID